MAKFEPHDIDGWDDIRGGLDPTCYMTQEEFVKHGFEIVDYLPSKAPCTDADSRFMKEFMHRTFSATGDPTPETKKLANAMWTLMDVSYCMGYRTGKGEKE